jgi:imidazolonepropionase-like amidohydrolase
MGLGSHNVKTLICARGLIDGTGTGYRPNYALLVERERILRVGEKEALQLEAERLLELGDTVLLPGFVDAHTHITIRPGEGDQHGQLRAPPVRQALRGVENLRKVLHSGVTTIRVMGERDGIDLEFKRAIAAGEIPGPRLRVATQALSATHGHGVALGCADGKDGLRKAVRENISLGADHIKIFVTGGVSSGGKDLYAYHYSREEIRVVVEEAHRASLPVAAHAHGGDGVSICAEEGVDSIEHGALLTPDNIAKMLEHRTSLVLTNAIAFHPTGIEQGDAGDATILEKMRKVRQTVEETFEGVRGSGLPFALGTDSMHGLFGYEMAWLVARGLTPEEAVIAGTRRGAEVLRLAGDIGTLEVGKLADIVAVRGNPLEDIQAVNDVAVVIKEGRVLVDHR